MFQTLEWGGVGWVSGKRERGREREEGGTKSERVRECERAISEG
jgi:hypothetical protein